MTALLHSPVLDDQFHRAAESQRPHHRIRHRRTRANRFCLAAMLSNVEETFYHGQHALIDNANISWLLLRDRPGTSLVQRQQGFTQRFRITQAILRHGMPVIDFAVAADRDLCFASLKHSIPQRQMQVLRKLDAALAHRSNDQQSFASEECFPVSYLAFPISARYQLYWLATAQEGCCSYLRCPSCTQCINLRCFRQRNCQLYFFENGTFVSGCPLCQVRHKWFLEDLRPFRRARWFTSIFQKGFCNAIARGLPVKAVGPCVYRGIDSPPKAQDSAPQSYGNQADCLNLMCHLMESQIDGSFSRIYLPKDAQVLAHFNQVLEAGEVWAKAVAVPPWPWLRLTASQRWAKLLEVCGDFRTIGFLQRLWFEQNLIWLQERPKEILLRADLLGQPCRELPPHGLYWDLEPASQQLDGMLETITLSTLPARGRGGFQLFNNFIFEGKSADVSLCER